MKIEIKHRYEGNIILCGEYESVKDCLAKNRGANLRGANLWGANLRGANLWGANLRGANGITLPIVNVAGTKDEVYYHNGIIQIGCNKFAVDYWLQNAEKIGKDAEYTEEEIAEYIKYIKAIAEIVER